MEIVNRSTPKERQAEIDRLKKLALQGGPAGEAALEELSGAAYDNPEARAAIQEIEVTPPSPGHADQERDPAQSGFFSALTHAGEVSLSDWPLEDQKRMKSGMLPKLGDHPEHPEV